MGTLLLDVGELSSDDDTELEDEGAGAMGEPQLRSPVHFRGRPTEPFVSNLDFDVTEM